MSKNYDSKIDMENSGLTIWGRKTSWLTVLVLVFGTSILVVSFLFWLNVKTKQELDIGYGITTNTDSARLEVGDKVFSISKNYIWSREDWKGGKVAGLNLHALLPNFEPATQANRPEFEKPGWERKISLLLQEYAMPENGTLTGHVSMTRQEIYERITDNQSARDINGPFGLRQKKFKKKLSTDNEIFVGTKRDGSFYWVSCRPNKRVQFPSCNTYIEYSKHVYIGYTFPKTHLSDWMTIEEGVLNLVHQFESNAIQGEHK